LEKVKLLSEIVKNVIITVSLGVGVFVTLWGQGNKTLVEVKKSKELENEKKSLEIKGLSTTIANKKLKLLSILEKDIAILQKDFDKEKVRKDQDFDRLLNLRDEIQVKKKEQLKLLNEIKTLLENIAN